jgi:hypothetical protein
MATNILAAVRQCPCLHGNLKFTALELAHRMNAQGYGRVAHQMMAWKTGYSLRTAFRHMRTLLDLRVFAKTVYRTANGYGINLYRCLLSIPAFYRAAPATTHHDSLTSTLPTPKAAEEKSLSLREELARHRKGLRFLTNTESPMYQACVEKIAALEALQRTP